MKINQQGLTLIELIVAMVVISVALVGVMSVINYTTLHSADPVLRHQAIAIAEAYMEEIVLKSFCEPDQTSTECEENPCPDSEASRDLYDNVCDYNGLPDKDVRNPDGNLIPDLEPYKVEVSISKQGVTATGFDDPSAPPYDALRVDVTVTDPANESLTLTGYRANY